MSFASQATRGSGQFTDSELDLSALGSSLWRKKWRILRPALLVGLVALITVQVITPRYQSESRVIVEGRDNIYLRPDADKDTLDRTVDQEAVTSQAQLILSRDLANQVIEKLKLNQRPEFELGARRDLADQGSAWAARHRQESDEHDAGRARARSLLRPVDGISGGQIARHRHRFSVGGSGAGSASGECHSRRLFAIAAEGQARPGADRQPSTGRPD